MERTTNLAIYRWLQRKKNWKQHIPRKEERRICSVTCNAAKIVKRPLKGSSRFTNFVEKDNTKGLVIVRYGVVISLYSQRGFIRKIRLNIKDVKKLSKLKQQVCGSAYPRKKGPSNELVKFHVITKGDKYLKIFRNSELKTAFVYAFKAETVKQAFRGNSRFLNILFNHIYGLSNTTSDILTEMLNVVDNLDGKIYKMIRLKLSNPPNHRPRSRLRTNFVSEKYERSENNESEDPSQLSATSKRVNNKFLTTKKKYKKDCPAIKGYVHNISPDHIDQSKLSDFSNSVCVLKINGEPSGTGFLLFGKFVLTNGHVAKKIYHSVTRIQNGNVTVHFSHEPLNQLSKGQEFGEFEVKEVTGFEFGPDVSGYMYDWALLEINADQKLPGGLLNHFGFVPPSGRIFIIGHPDGGIKRLDKCSIIPFDGRKQFVEKTFQRLNLGQSERFMDKNKSYLYNRQVLTYKSCFYHVSSGSPVFDESYKVVAMHSGGWFRPDAEGKNQNVIDFSYRLSDIIEHLIVQMVKRKKYDALNAFIECNCKHLLDIMNNVRKLVDSRNLMYFRNVNCSEYPNLKFFFDFFSETEEPLPMETNTSDVNN